MLLISLDEGGHFERNRIGNKCMMIGGAIFNGTEDDIYKESKRLVRLFMMVCDEQQCDYPSDLHYNRAGDAVINATSANKVKNALIQELPSFFKGTGRWSGDQPNGTYMIYALLGDPTGMASMNQTGLGNLVNDQVSGNRYEHMAYRAVQNLLLYNLNNHETSFRLDLATRLLATDHDPQMTEEANEQGLRTNQNDASKYQLTDNGSFRAMLAQSILETGRTNIQVDLNVQSISYHPNKAERQAFLYLADTLCSAYQDAVSKLPTCRQSIGKLTDCCRKLVGNDFKVWVYQDLDEDYRRAVRYYREKDYFRCLMSIQKIRHIKNEVSDYYNEAWLKDIERGITIDSCPEQLKIALIQLEDYLDAKECNLDDAISVHHVLKSQWKHLKMDADHAAPLLYSLCKTEMTISNHRGDYETAMQAYQECMKNAWYVRVEDYLELQNMLAVAQHDHQKMEEALETVKSNMEYERLLLDVKKEIWQENGNVNIHYGRTCSQAGQYHAFCGQPEEACKWFEEAIGSFGTNMTEIDRTRSYYLHTLIEMNDREAYEREAVKYFGGKDLMKQYLHIRDLQGAGGKFALYVFAKALYFFYRDQQTDILKEIIRGIWSESENNLDHHPWEMILKYCALVMETRSIRIKNLSPDDLMARAAKAVEEDQDGILPEIVRQGKLQFENVKNGKPVFEGVTLTYMYR